ncbi:MAG TPA: A/G-specific adenine glycosylase [Nitrospirales bacterium]|nr:A/G-specific adenine glycosylase [Nitrospirales bacterium]HIO21037.1 A/G-specific adenine glycosylase [Nitrospirales bacterium]
MPRSIPAPFKRKFQQQLLRWYRKNGRELPWRETTDPYSILVSEVMLQQTQVDRVVPKYHEFLSKYPTLQALAKARARDVKKTWYPLGYNIRPVQLHSIARETVAHYGGQLPSSDEALQSFKGIGRYTSGAIRSFAFLQDAPILDTNVRRVLLRVFLGTPRAKPSDKRMWALSEELLPRGRTYDFNQALMDFGACICSEKTPACPRCPMKGFCKAYSKDVKKEDRR